MIKELHKRLTAIEDVRRINKISKRKSKRALVTKEFKERQLKLQRATNKRTRELIKSGLCEIQAIFIANYEEPIKSIYSSKNVLLDKISKNRFTGTSFPIPSKGCRAIICYDDPCTC